MLQSRNVQSKGIYFLYKKQTNAKSGGENNDNKMKL